MTTGNQIVTNTYDSVLFIPLEALHANDSISFVYTRKGKRQVVVVGDMNENFIIVEKGLKPGEELYLSTPEKPEKFEFTGFELIPEIKKRKEDKLRQEAELRQQQQELMNKRKNGFGMPGQGNVMIISTDKPADNKNSSSAPKNTAKDQKKTKP